MIKKKRNRSLKVMHLITSLDIGGAETMLMRVINHFNRNELINNVVCLTKKGKIGGQIEKNGFEVIYLDMPRGKLTINGIYKLISHMVKYRPDILQTWLYHSDLIGLITGRMIGVKKIFWNLRCSFIDLKSYRVSTRFVLQICKIFSSLPDAIVSNSHEAIRYHKKLGYRNRSWLLIPNGVDANRFVPDLKARKSLAKELKLESRPSEKGREEAQSYILIGCVARFDPMKDHITLVKAALQVLQKRSDVVFILVGRDVEWHNPFFDSAIPNTSQPFFQLLGERRDIERIMAALDIFLLTSYGEGFPNVLCEAMACGVPCVATDVGDCRRIIGGTGRVVEARNPRAICDAVLEICSLNSAQRRQMGQGARQRILDHFTIDAVADRYAALYERFRARQDLDRE